MVSPPITFLIGTVAWIASIALGVFSLIYSFLHASPAIGLVCLPLALGVGAAVLASWRSPEPLMTILFAILAPLMFTCSSLAIIFVRRRQLTREASQRRDS